MNIVNWITSHWVELSAAATTIVFGARIIVKLTPTPKDDSVLDGIVKLLKQVGLTSDTIEKK